MLLISRYTTVGSSASSWSKMSVKLKVPTTSTASSNERIINPIEASIVKLVKVGRVVSERKEAAMIGFVDRITLIGLENLSVAKELLTAREVEF